MPGGGAVAAVLLCASAVLAADRPKPKSAAAIRNAKGKELVENICILCHEYHRVTIQHLSKEEWRGLIKGMIDQAAPVTDEEFSMMLDYLAKNFGLTKNFGDNGK